MVSKLCLLSFLVSMIACDSFFFFNQKKTTAEEIVVYNDGPVSRVRGVPQFIEDKYTSSESLFECANHEKFINHSSVNDEYCDCADGSDEPGTSACSDVPVPFYCINKGYKTIKLFTSRVDDGICDCCDGSDEGHIIRCPNTCAKIAEQEKEELEKTKEVYRYGSKILADAEANMRKNLESKIENQPAHKKEVDVLTFKIASVRSQSEHQMAQLKDLYENTRNSAFDEIRNLFAMDSLPVAELARLLSSLFDILHLSEADISSTMRGNYHMVKEPDVPHHHDDEHEHDHEHDPYASDDEHYQGHDYDDLRHESHDDDHEHHHDIDAEAAPEEHRQQAEVHENAVEVPVDNSDIESCELYAIAKDSRMRPLCQLENMMQAAKNLITEHIIRSKQPFREYQLLLGYYSIHRTFDNSAAFVQETIANTEANACSIQFEGNPSVCQLQEKFTVLYSLFDKSIDSIDKENLTPTEKYYLETKDVLHEAENQLRTAEQALNECQQAEEELQNPNLAHLAYKGEKVSVQDGRYSYSVYMMDRTTQAEGNEVTLGKYKDIEEGENGELVLKFGDGDYCWNFGARTADVQMSCGKENKLLSAREPSTCFYLLTMESPLACTKKFAHANGIEV